MTDSSIPDFADVVPETTTLDGDKMPIEEILNVPITVIEWRIDKSKFLDHGANTERLTLQFILNDERRITFTGSAVLIQQIREFEKRSTSRTFRTIIRKINKFYKFASAAKQGGASDENAKNAL